MATPETALKKAATFDVGPRLGDRKERGIEEIEKKARKKLKNKVGVGGLLFGREQMLDEDMKTYTYTHTHTHKYIRTHTHKHTHTQSTENTCKKK